MNQSPDNFDAVIVGAGAAGLMAAIIAGRSKSAGSVLILEGARSLGAKILVAGGGRCNVTHDQVDEKAFAGSTPPAIRNVLRRFTVEQTIEFFREIGVELKREPLGKMFPVTESARSVLNALLDAAKAAQVRIDYPRRVEQIVRTSDGRFQLDGKFGSVLAKRVVLATGGRSLPKSGSDGQGYELAKSLGHSLTPRVFPALVPLCVKADSFIRDLSGIATDVQVEVRSGTGKRLSRFSGAALCTHFGLSGPVILDVSRSLLDARLDDSAAGLFINWLADVDAAQLEAILLEGGRVGVATVLRKYVPDRLAAALSRASGLEPGTSVMNLTRQQRRMLVETATAFEVPFTGDRGWNYAEVTAGGVPLREIDPKTMESRCCPALHLCGEICDVDGLIGGYNFQWAWSSGYITGRALRHITP